MLLSFPILHSFTIVNSSKVSRFLPGQDILPANNRIRCALCNKESNIGEQGSKRSAVMYIGLGLACIIVCLGLMATTMGLRHNAGYWYIYLGKF